MKPGSILKLVPPVAAIKLLRRRIPLIVSIVVTTRCNFDCGYCGCGHSDAIEPDHDRLIELFGELARAGTHKVIFTGGEPLLRSDLKELIKAAKTSNLAVSINTNGSTIECLKESVRLLDGISISLDGPESIHDSIRQQGSFKALIKTAELVHSHGIPMRFAMVATKINLDCLAPILEICRRFDSPLSIQPASRRMLFKDEENPLAPEPGAFREFVDRVIAVKRKGEPVSNSFPGLAYLRSWPEPSPIDCAGGRVFCRVEACGGITICGRDGGNKIVADINEVAFREAFELISTPECNACWCGLLAELNLSFALRPSSLYNIARYF